LNDLLDLAKIGAKRVRYAGGAPFGALEHDPHRRQDLAEIVVQLARNRTESALLHADELPRQFAAALREVGHLVEHSAVVLNQVEGRRDDQNQHQRDK
jgi:hypothetical protein